MSASQIVSQMKQDVGAAAILNNSIIAPITNATDAGNWQVILNSYIPKQIQFYSYGLTVTVSVQFGTSPALQIPLAPGGYRIVPVPSGTTAINAEIVGNPTLQPQKTVYAVCVSF